MTDYALRFLSAHVGLFPCTTMSRQPPPSKPEADQQQRLELGALVLSMVFAFLLMAGYSLLKPVRDEVGSAHHEQISWLWSGTFLVMLALVPLFGWAASRFPRRRLVPGVYHFFTLNLLVFYLLLPPASWVAAALAERVVDQLLG